LWRRIKEVLSLLAAAGIEAGRVEDRTGSKITLRKLPKNDATNATEGETREGKPKEGGIKAEDDATANATGRSNATSNPTEKADSYADYGNSGDSGNRNGDSWQNDAMRHYGGVASYRRELGS
jgi:hypothetical protein